MTEKQIIDGITPFSGTKDRDRTYLDIQVVRRYRWFATCNGFVASIPHPRTADLVELAVCKVARRAFANYWDVGGIDAAEVKIECETPGFEYIASTLEIARA